MKIWIPIALIIVTILCIWAWRTMTGPMYRPGDARRALDSGAAGVELYRFQQGQGRDVLVVHGGPGFPPDGPWRAGARLAAEGYRLTYYHQRGCGRSGRPITSISGSNRYEQMKTVERALGLAAQVGDIERLRRELGREKLVLLGHSFGADIATLYAAEFPEHVEALIAVAPANMAVLPTKGSGLFDLIRARLPVGMRSEYEAYLKEYFDFGAALQRTEAQSSEFYGRLAKFYGAAAQAREVGGSDIGGTGYVPLGVYLSMGKHHDYTEAYRSVKAPVLVIHGGADLQPEEASRAFAAWFANARFVRIEGASHFVFNDRPEEFARAVSEFLDYLASR